MNSDQMVLGVALVGTLLALSIYYAWRQVQLFRRPGAAGEPGTPEVEYRRAQARRRLIGSGLMLVLAAQLAGELFFLDERAKRQGDRADARAEARERGGEAQPGPEERSFARFYGVYWLVFMLVLLAVVVLAFIDMWATRRFAVQAHRQLQAERRDMIDRQIARLKQEKQERNGHS